VGMVSVAVASPVGVFPGEPGSFAAYFPMARWIDVSVQRGASGLQGGFSFQFRRMDTFRMWPRCCGCVWPFIAWAASIRPFPRLSRLKMLAQCDSRSPVRVLRFWLLSKTRFRRAGFSNYVRWSPDGHSAGLSIGTMRR